VVSGGGESTRSKKKTPALTPSVLREVMSRLLVLRMLTLEGMTREVNATLRRKEEARIYSYHHETGRYPPRRTETSDGPAAWSQEAHAAGRKCQALQ